MNHDDDVKLIFMCVWFDVMQICNAMMKRDCCAFTFVLNINLYVTYKIEENETFISTSTSVRAAKRGDELANEQFFIPVTLQSLTESDKLLAGGFA